MAEKDDRVSAEEPAAPAPAPAPEVQAAEAARASWEEPHLAFKERIHKHWRQMIVHLWGPAGSVLFHILALAVLISFAAGGSSSVVTSEQVEIETKAQTEKLDEPVKPEKIDKPDDTTEPPAPDSTGVANEPTTEPLGGSALANEGVGLGSGDTSLPDKGFEISTTVKSRLVMKGLYAGRTAAGRAGALGMYSKGGAGSAATEAAVLRALRWLKKNQESDGSWKGSKMNVPPAMTAMALLTFLAHGETPTSREFGETVKKAIDWMINNQDANGMFKGHDGNNYSQPIAAYALCEAYGLTQHPSVKDAALKAVTLVLKGQHVSGGFNYGLEAVSERNDSSYMAWCCQALKAAKMAGLEADLPDLEKVIKKAILGFKQNAHPDGGFGYTGPARSGLSGAGALCMQLLGAGRAPEVKATMAFLSTCTFSFATPDQQPYGGGSQVYYWYYITQAKFHDSEETFKAWNKLFSPELCKVQIIEKNAIEDADGKLVDIGHWESPCGKAEHSGGLVQETSFCALMLEVYYRYLPSFKPVEAMPDDVATAVAPKNEDIAVKIK